MADYIPASTCVEDEAFDVGDEEDLYLQVLSYLTEDERALLNAYLDAGSNCAELARRIGADKSYVAKKVKALRTRFHDVLEEIKNFF